MTADDKAREIAEKHLLKISTNMSIAAAVEQLTREREALASEIAAALASAEQAGRDKGLEEAAKIAEGLLVQQEGGVFTDEHDAKDRHGSSVAAAIRARKAEKETTT